MANTESLTRKFFSKNKVVRVPFSFVTVFILVNFSCGNDDLPISESFQLKIADSMVYGSGQIDFYDQSSHLIYLNEENSFSYQQEGDFDVIVNQTAVYSGKIVPRYSSYLPGGPVIYTAPSFYGDYIIAIEFSHIAGQEADLRGDEKILDALRKNNQLRQGLVCELVAIDKTATGGVSVELSLTNKDSEDLLYLDPEKMGNGLFHYFTNGLILWDSDYRQLTHHVSVEAADNNLSLEWLSVLAGNETKMISINYDSFDLIAPDQYTASFSFPSPGNLVTRNEVRQTDGRIWLGTIEMTKPIKFE